MSLDSETKKALAEELEDIAMELANISQSSIVTPASDKEQKEVKQCIQSIQAEIERLTDLSELYEYEALTLISTWVYKNTLALEASPEQLAHKNKTGLFYLWIELLAALLQEYDDQLSIELETALLDSHWNHPVNKQQLQQLLDSLRIAPLIVSDKETHEENYPSFIEDNSTEQLIIKPETKETTTPVIEHKSSYRLAPDDDVHPELLEAFFLETPDQVIEVAALIRTISEGKSNQETHQLAARTAHTIKGSSAVVGLEAVASFAHKLEDILEYSVEQTLPPEVADLLVESSDCLEAMFDSLLTHSQPPQQYPQLLKQLTQWDKKFSSGFIYTPPINTDSNEHPKETDKPTPALNENKTSKKEKNDSYTLGWNKDVHPELLEAYLGETPEHVIEIAELLRNITQLEHSEKHHDPLSDTLSKSCQKASLLIHTIKGSSATIGINAVANFGKPLEEILDYAVKHSLPPRLSELLTESADLLESLYDSLLSEGTPPKEYPNLYEKLSHWQQYLSNEPLEKEVVEPEKPEKDKSEKNESKQDKSKQDKYEKDQRQITPVIDEKQIETTTDNSNPFNLHFQPLEEILIAPSVDNNTANPAVTTPVRANLNETTLRVPISVIDKLLSFSSELMTHNTQMADQITLLLRERQAIDERNERVRNMLDELEWAVNQQTATLSRPSMTKQTQSDHLKSAEIIAMDSLEMDSYNELHSITALLSETVEDDHKMSLSLTQQLNALKAQSHSQKQINNQLNSTVLQMRMESAKILAPRLQRIVRETCRQTNKQAELEIIGDEIALDTDVIKGLIDPLLHLLRNAVDHGIEPADIRQQKNKNKSGKIQLNFSQQNDQVLLTLKDDGAGIDADKVYQTAIKKGLITAETKLSQNEKLRLILRPGFSTRDEITETSGRGVGMDVVNSAIKNLSGNISIRSEKNKGSEIQIQVPLTLSTANILLVDILGYTFAIPNAFIQQIHYLSPHSVEQKEGRLFIDYHQQAIPLLSLSPFLSWPSSKFISDKSQSVLIVEHQNQYYALYVDQILKPLNITIKTLKPWMTNVTGVNGVCLLPNGVVAPALNLPELLRSANDSTLKQRPNIGDSYSININQDKILVVDDSLSNRTALRLMLEALGHQVCTAVDGADALQQIEQSPFKLIVTDLEMPKMNGLEMVESLRTWSGTRKLPIIMITSRSTEKHRKLAAQAGVDEYLTKPVDKSTLQSTVDKYIAYKSLDKVEL